MISWGWNRGLFVVLLFLLFFISSGILRAHVVIKERITIKVPPCRDQIITMRQFRIESEEVRIQQSLFH